MKIYMVEAGWYDKIYEVNCTQNIAAFMSKESAQKYIDTFPEANEEAGRRIQELLDKRGYKVGQVIDNNDKELMAAFDAHICFNDTPYDELEFWISEYELKN